MGRNGVAESPRPVPDGSEPTEAPAAEPPSPALPASSYRRVSPACPSCPSLRYSGRPGLSPCSGCLSFGGVYHSLQLHLHIIALISLWGNCPLHNASLTLGG